MKDSVDLERERIQAELEAPRKDFAVIFGRQTQHMDGYQAACQRASDLYKNGEDPLIVIRYSKPNAPTIIKVTK